MRPRAGWLLAVFAGAFGTGTWGCAPYHPPFTQASSASAGAPPSAHQATVVFLWPATSCDPGGYVTLVTADGRYVGNVARGTQLRAEVPAGESTIVGWNEVREASDGALTRANVPVLHARLAEGRTYYVRIVFGAWNETGPAPPRWSHGTRSRPPTRYCEASAGPAGVTSAMVTLPPASARWNEVPEWTAKLEAIAPDRAAGQAWVNAQGELLRAHIAEGEGRYAGLAPEAKRLATLEVEDGVALQAGGR
jgi:hypothetical protein